MAKLYCFSCGQPTEYSLNEPRFCSSCGSSFKVTATANKPLSPPPKPTVVMDDDDDDDEPTGVERVPKLEQLSVKITKSKASGIKVKDLIGTSSPRNSEDVAIRQEPPKKMSRKKFLEEFRKEAGTLRKS